MEEPRPISPEAPPQDLWSSILDSVSSSRSTPAKQVLILGEPSSGKSTLTSALLHKAIPDEDSEDHQRSDFALGYDWADVRDDADEGEARDAPVRDVVAHSRVMAVRYSRKTVSIHSALFCAVILRVATSFSPTTNLSPAYSRDHRARLDEALDFRRRASDVAGVDRDMGQDRYLERSADRTRREPRKMYVFEL